MQEITNAIQKELATQQISGSGWYEEERKRSREWDNSTQQWQGLCNLTVYWIESEKYALTVSKWNENSVSIDSFSYKNTFMDCAPEFKSDLAEVILF